MADLAAYDPTLVQSQRVRNMAHDDHDLMIKKSGFHLWTTHQIPRHRSHLLMIPPPLLIRREEHGNPRV
jgi:hypothetical protein